MNTSNKIIAALFFTVTLFAGPCVMAQTQKIEATSTTVTSEGTLTEFGPQGVSITTEPGEQPVRYLSNDTTNYVDEAGNPVDVSTIKSGVPVQVFYTKVGDTLIASKVLVRKARIIPAREPSRVVVPGTTKVVPAPPAVQQTEVKVRTPGPAPETVVVPATPPRDRLENSTISTTRWGTVSGFGQDTIILQSDSSLQPLPYLVTKKTTYVDESGAPIMADSIRRGAPVTIYSTREGDRLIASRVILKTADIAPPADPSVIVTPESGTSPPAVIEKKTTTTTTTRK